MSSTEASRKRKIFGEGLKQATLEAFLVKRPALELINPNVPALLKKTAGPGPQCPFLASPAASTTSSLQADYGSVQSRPSAEGKLVSGISSQSAVGQGDQSRQDCPSDSHEEVNRLPFSIEEFQEPDALDDAEVTEFLASQKVMIAEDEEELLDLSDDGISITASVPDNSTTRHAKRKDLTGFTRMMLEDMAPEIMSRLNHRRLSSSRQIDQVAELAELVNVGRRSRSEDELSSASPAFRVLLPAAELLLELCDSPQQTAFTSEYTLERSQDDDVRGVDDRSAQFYLRVFTYENFTAYFADLNAFVLRMPARLFLAIRSLIEIGGSKADVLGLTTAVSQLGGVASPELHDVIPTVLLSAISVDRSLHEDRPVHMCYGGCTLRYTPAERMKQDIIAQHRPYTAWSDIASVPAMAYRFRDVTIAASSTLSWRVDRTIGDVENIIISCVGPGLNADSGGWMERYVTPAPIKELLKVGFHALGPLPALDPHDHADTSGQVFRVRRCVMRIQKWWTRQRTSGQPAGAEEISPEGLKNVIESLSAVPRLRGQALAVTLLDDNPAEAFRGMIGGPWSETASRAMNSLQRIITSLLPTSSSLEPAYSLDRQTGSSVFGAIFDIFSVCLPNSAFHQAVYGTSEVLQRIDPVILGTWSSLCAHTVQYGDGFRVVSRLPAVDMFSANPLPMRELRQKDFASRLGKPCIINYGPSQCDTAVTMAMRHMGELKYEPLLATVRKELGAVCLCLHILLIASARVILTRGPISTVEADERFSTLSQVIRVYETAAKTSGLIDQLERSLEAVRKLELPLHRLSQ